MKTIIYANYRDCFVNRRLLVGVRRIAALHHWNLQTVPPVNAADMRKIVEFWHPDGILYGASGDNEAPELRSIKKIPVVLIDALPPHGKSGLKFRVCCDNEAVVEAAAREVFASDMTDYAFCGIKNHYEWTQKRANTFENLVALHGGHFHMLWIPESGICDADTFETLKKIPRPYGILAANDEAAAIILGACSVAKLNIPKDVTITSIDDDILICENTKPTLTSVRLNHESAGFMAAELLENILSNHKPARHTLYFGPMMTIHRASTRRKLCADASVADAIEFIRAEINRPLDVNDVAEKMGCSKRMAQLRFSRSLGQTISEVIRAIRLERVQYYLRQPDLPIGEIATQCGYVDESALRRFFKKETRRSMRAWRRNSTP